MGFGLSSNLDAFMARFEAVASRQLPFALSRALNDTAEDVRKAEIATMRRVFDRPTPYTLNAFQIKPSTKANLSAAIERKATAGKRHYLEREASGGPRAMAGFERLLEARIPSTAIIRAILPADNAKLDQYGNWSSGERNQVMAALGAFRDSASNRSAASIKRKGNGKRAASISKYFVPTSGLPQALYERTQGGQLKVILAFTAAAPNYQDRFPFEETAQQAAEQAFAGHLSLRFAEAVNTAR